MATFDAQAPIAVLGAGWAGLAAAFELARLGHRVQLIDAAPQAGGRARRLRLQLLGIERDLDNGQHLLIGAYRDTRALLNRAQDLLGEAPSPALLQPFHLRSVDGLDFRRLAWADEMRPWRWLPQAGTALGLLAARGLSLSDKLAFGRLDRLLKESAPESLAGQTVSSLLARARQPAKLITGLWDPLCVSALNTGIGEACAQTFVQVLRDSLLQGQTPESEAPAPHRAGKVPASKASGHAGSASAPGHGMASDYLIPEQDLSSYFVSPMLRAFEHLGGQLELRRTVRSLDDLPARAWVLAVPPSSAAPLLAAQSPERAGQLERFDYQSITTVYLAWPESLAGRFPSRRWPSPLLLRESAKEQAWGQWLFDRGFAGGIHVAAVVVSARGRLADLATDELSQRIAEQVHRQTGLPMPKAWRAITEKRATISCTPQRPRFAAQDLMLEHRGLDGLVRPVMLAGDYTYSRYPATLESAVRSGLLAAQALPGIVALPHRDAR